MSDGRCKNCRHWKTHPRYGDYNVCELAGSEDGNPAAELAGKTTKALAYALDGSHYNARFITLGEFGCVQWEAKE